jgi:recombination protein RecR
MYPKSLRELIDSLKYLPGVGEKTAERYAFSLINQDDEKIELLSKSILDSKKKIKRCEVCNGLSEETICNICSDSSRDKDVLCVIEDPKSIFIFEKLGVFKGIYHVLDGLISPLDGISPNDIGLDKLINRIKDGNFKEIILAFKPSIEGETTSLYIKRVLEGLDVNVTKIASGIPMGADMEYIDTITLERAIKDRKIVE